MVLCWNVVFLSVLVFAFGILSMIKVNRYIVSLGMLEGKPSILRKKTAIILIVAYALLLAGFLISLFSIDKTV